MVNNNLLWTTDEYEAVAAYKSNSYNKINVLLSSEITKRETEGKYKVQIPQTKEELRETIEKITLMYSAIRKYYVLNGRHEFSKALFRGKRSGKLDMSFLSTSDSAKTAFDFAKMFERMKEGTGTLLAIDSGTVPWINISDVIPSGDGIEDEPEILFLPSQADVIEQISLKELFDIAKEQGERIPAEQSILKNFASLKCEKVALSELDYSNEKTELTIDDLSGMFEQYRQDIEVIRSVPKDSSEYVGAYTRVRQFKKDCSTFIHQRFYEINQSIDNQIGIVHDSIQLSSQYDIQEVFIGNTGEMYQISDRENGREYYFKPAVSKSSEIRPYRAYIQESAYNIQQIINPDNAVKCNRAEINGMFGAIQEKVPVDTKATKTFIDYFDNDIGELPTEIISQVIDEYLVDFCLCNYDAHASNFVIDENGRLRGIDKEQAFRYIRNDSGKDMLFATNYNERYGENPTIYNTVFEQMKQGKISYEYLKALRYKASRLSQFPNEQYKKIFEKYAYDKSKTPEEAEELLSSILERKSNILQNIEQLYDGIYNEWSKNKNNQKTNSILDSAIKATEETTRTSTINEQVQTIKTVQRDKQSTRKQGEYKENTETKTRANDNPECFRDTLRFNVSSEIQQEILDKHQEIERDFVEGRINKVEQHKSEDIEHGVR